MLITRETDYAMRCILYLSDRKHCRTTVGEIADEMCIPQTYLSKILQRLVRAGIVESVRGLNGGFQLLKKPTEITLYDILDIMQGVPPINVCAVNAARCGLSSYCVIHPVWTEIRDVVTKRLRKETFGKLLKQKQRRQKRQVVRTA